jgi:hypothetical protein
MKKTCLALAALAALGFSGVAYAGDTATGAAQTTATAPTAMSDSDLDKVTAGVGVPNIASSPNPDYGIGVANDASTAPKGFDSATHPTGNSHAP